MLTRIFPGESRRFGGRASSGPPTQAPSPKLAVTRAPDWRPPARPAPRTRQRAGPHFLRPQVSQSFPQQSSGPDCGVRPVTPQSGRPLLRPKPERTRRRGIAAPRPDSRARRTSNRLSVGEPKPRPRNWFHRRRRALLAIKVEAPAALPRDARLSPHFSSRPDESNAGARQVSARTRDNRRLLDECPRWVPREAGKSRPQLAIPLASLWTFEALNRLQGGRPPAGSVLRGAGRARRGRGRHALRGCGVLSPRGLFLPIAR